MEKLAVRGYVEVLRHFREILGIRGSWRALLAERPALFIGVDAPDFNLGLERQLKDAGIPAIALRQPLALGLARRAHAPDRALGDAPAGDVPVRGGALRERRACR